MADASLGQALFELGASTAAAAPAHPNKEYIAGTAAIGYVSMLDAYDVSITATSETTGYEGVNVRSRLTYSGWRPSATGAQSLTFTGTQGHTVDYLGIAGHNLASKAATIDLQQSDDGSTWTSMLSGGYAPSSDAPFMLMFSAESKNHFRLVVNVSGVAYPTIAVVMLGERLSLQRGIYVGHRPAPFSRSVSYLTEQSEGGQIIGRSVMRRSMSTDISFKNITPTWARAYLVPFFREAETSPFFFVWNTATAYKGEVIYGCMENEPQLMNERKSFMAADLNIRGLA